jgi:hypothetical protein
MLADRAAGRAPAVLLMFGAMNAETIQAREHAAEQLKTLFRAYERLSTRPVPVPDVLWRDDVAPGWGESRV